MPTKRTRRTRGRAMMTLDTFTAGEQLDFAIGWLPGRGRWSDWQEYAADYAEVRQEFLDSTWMDGRKAPAFAELVFQRWGADGPPPGTDVHAAIRTFRNLKGI